MSNPTSSPGAGDWPDHRAKEPASALPANSAVDVRSLIAAHHAAVYRFAYRLTGQQADAEDVSQQTFLVAHQNLQQLRQPENPLPWLLTIARSCWLKSARRKRPVSAATVDLNIDEVAAPRTEPELVDPQQLQSALDELPDDFKLVVVMFYFQECSYKQIAADLEIPIGTVMSRLARAKAHLRKRLGWVDEEPPQKDSKKDSHRDSKVIAF